MPSVQVRKLSHCAFHCNYHIVLVTKYRKEIFDKGTFEYFRIRLQELRKYYPIIEILKVNHDKDHVHLLLSIPPTMSVGRVVNLIKSNSGKKMREKFPFLKEVYYGSSGIITGTPGVAENAPAQGFAEQVLGASSLTPTPVPTGAVLGTEDASKKSPWWPWLLFLLIPGTWFGYRQWKKRNDSVE